MPDQLTAWQLILNGDPALFAIVKLSLAVSLSAVVLAASIGMPLGALLALTRFPGRFTVVVVLNALMGLPPVVVGLAVYLLLSRSGPLGTMGILFTPSAMVIAQTILIVPIIAALTRQTVEDLWAEYRDELTAMDVGPTGRMITLLWDARYSLLTALLAGFGRAAAEVGAVMIVGGNIDGFTRTMTTAVALETSKGNLPLAVGLGLLLGAIVLAVNAAAWGAAGGRHRDPQPFEPDHYPGRADADRRAEWRGQDQLAAALHGACGALERPRHLGRPGRSHAVAPRDPVSAPGDAAKDHRCQRRLCAGAGRHAAPAARAARRRLAGPRRAFRSGAAAGAAALGRRAAAAGAGAGAGARSRNIAARRTHRQSRSRRDARRPGGRAHGGAIRHQDRDGLPRSRPGAAARRRRRFSGSRRVVRAGQGWRFSLPPPDTGSPRLPP